MRAANPSAHTHTVTHGRLDKRVGHTAAESQQQTQKSRKRHRGEDKTSKHKPRSVGVGKKTSAATSCSPASPPRQGDRCTRAASPRQKAGGEEEEKRGRKAACHAARAPHFPPALGPNTGAMRRRGAQRELRKTKAKETEKDELHRGDAGRGEGTRNNKKSRCGNHTVKGRSDRGESSWNEGEHYTTETTKGRGQRPPLTLNGAPSACTHARTSAHMYTQELQRAHQAWKACRAARQRDRKR